MRRRDFIRNSAGVIGLLGSGVSHAVQNSTSPAQQGFDIHPFVRSHPEAVFIVRTKIESKKDENGIRAEGQKLARELIVKTGNGGFPLSTLVTVKHNWHGIQHVDDLLGENTDPNFIEGWILGMMDAGPQKYYANAADDLVSVFKTLDFKALAQKNGVNIEDYNKHYWQVPDGAIRFKKIPDGVVFDTMGHTTPYGEPETFLVNLAKLKAHSMGITATVKNLQGLCPGMFRQFCTPYDQLRRNAGDKYGNFLKKDFEKHIEELYDRHVRAGIPRWDKSAPGWRSGSGYSDGIWQEQWVERMIDSFSVSPKGLHIVEGIYGMDGNGFGAGPHEKSPKGYTSRDFMSNVLIFGLDPFRIDIITHWMAGHEPGNFGLFHIGIERGVSDVLDPRDIPVYFWENGKAVPTKLDDLPRTPLRTLYLQRDYKGQDEPTYHLCDEPFDYAAWKAGKRTGERILPVREPYSHDYGGMAREASLPGREHVYMDILDREGRIIGRLLADGELGPGTHRVVWDGFASPGLHNVYFRGMKWDADKQTVIRD
ncbi:DUF362 domain-containing protein [bacterium]|nr:DUF362 domain-containing protein [bacterium]